MTPDLVLISHIVNETIQFPERTIEPVLGSPAAYCSVIAGRLGVRTGIVTRIGTDFPPELLQPFAEANVDTRGIKVEGAHSTRSILIYDPSGDKEIRYPHRAPSILFDDFPADYLQAQIMYVCCMDYEVPLETVAALGELGATLAVDLGGYGGAHSSTHPDAEEQESHQALEAWIEHFQIVRASVEDCRYLFGAKSNLAEEAARTFVAYGADIGIVTLGEQGSLVLTPDDEFRTPAFPARVVDCTGAGDSFSAGFLVEYLRTREARKAALFAAATASLVIEGTGGVVAARMPTTDQVRERMSGGGKMSGKKVRARRR